MKENELTTDVIAEFEKEARQWGRDFISVYTSASVTPYIHAMMNHVSEFMKIHGHPHYGASMKKPS